MILDITMHILGAEELYQDQSSCSSMPKSIVRSWVSNTGKFGIFVDESMCFQ